jgi:hypothetical protein
LTKYQIEHGVSESIWRRYPLRIAHGWDLSRAKFLVLLFVSAPTAF